MFHLIKLIISIAVLLLLALLIMDYFGYEINQDYFSDSREKCEERLKACTKDLVRQGIDNVQCDYNCVDPKLIVKKK